MADPRHVAIEDDDPVKRRGNDERDDRYPYGGDRSRKKSPSRPAGSRTRTGTGAASSSGRAQPAPVGERRPGTRSRTTK